MIRRDGASTSARKQILTKAFPRNTYFYAKTFFWFLPIKQYLFQQKHPVFVRKRILSNEEKTTIKIEQRTQINIHFPKKNMIFSWIASPSIHSEIRGLSAY